MTLALDFGTCNTVLARWNPASRQVETLRFDQLTRLYPYQSQDARTTLESAVIPTLVHYGEKHKLLVGAQVEHRGLAEHPGTFRWLKLDLLKGNHQARRLNGKLITPRLAAEDFIATVLQNAMAQESQELVITVPVEAYDHYVSWLQEVVIRNFSGALRMLDEASACLLGHDIPLREGQTFLVFDFGGGTLDVSIIKTRHQKADRIQPPQVLARAGEELGGALIDQWMLMDLQATQRLTPRELADVGTALLCSIEDAKIRLSGGETEVEVTQFNDNTARLISHRFTQEDLSRLLKTQRAELNGLAPYQLVSRTLNRALELAQNRYGVGKSEIQGIFMVGGSCLLLGIIEVIQILFPETPLYQSNPFEAIARGACRYSREDNIQMGLVHDYCLRSWNREKQDYEMVAIVPKGTLYPTNGPITLKYLDAACDGAGRLELVVFERSEMLRPQPFYQMEGSTLRIVGSQDWKNSSLRALNPGDHEFVHVDPPCRLDDQKRFVVGFGVDKNRRLTLFLKDTRPNSRSYVELPQGERVFLPLKDWPLVTL